VPTTVTWSRERRAAIPALAGELHAAEFVHTTARGVAGEAPDPQIHSHVVITSVERADGACAAVRSRPVLRAARELGAFYRAELPADRALELTDALRGEGRVLTLADGRLTTARVRAMEAEIEERVAGLARDRSRTVGAPERSQAIQSVEERLGEALSAEQRVA